MTGDDNHLSDDELKKESIINEEISSDENLNDEEEELDFYDFLEVVSDKFDNITTQSKLKIKNL